MLTIFYGEKTTDDNDKPTTRGKTLEWRIGEKQPNLPILASKCVIVEASYAELFHIRNRFKNLPMADGVATRSVTWIGDDARFIAENLTDD